jgi:tRNA dimethylallyltransferase
LAGELGAGFHAELARLDPAMAARLRPTDLQRLARAHEVFVATGRSLAEWQMAKGEPFAGRALVVLLDPPPPELRPRIDARFSAMVGAGALAEVAALDLPAEAPLMKAVGVPELRRHLTGGTDLETAISAGQAATRAYAKRQRTWFRHQLPSNVMINQPLWTKDSEKETDRIFSFIDDFLLT